MLREKIQYIEAEVNRGLTDYMKPRALSLTTAGADKLNLNAAQTLSQM